MPTEPLWWERARELRADGLSYESIGLLLNKHHVSVIYAIDDERRMRVKETKRRSMIGKYVKRTRTAAQKARHSVVQCANEEARVTGRHVDEILIAWGDYPRRGSR